MDIDVVTLSRIQFALTIMFHYLFPPLTIGLGVVLVFLEYRWLRTDDPIYHDAARVLDEDVRHQLRPGRGDRHRDGIRVRHELGRVLAIRGGRVRFGAGGGGDLRVLPGIRVSWPCCCSAGTRSREDSTSSPPAWSRWAAFSRRSGSWWPTRGSRRRPDLTWSSARSTGSLSCGRRSSISGPWCSIRRRCTGWSMSGWGRSSWVRSS